MDWTWWMKRWLHSPNDDLCFNASSFPMLSSSMQDFWQRIQYVCWADVHASVRSGRQMRGRDILQVRGIDVPALLWTMMALVIHYRGTSSEEARRMSIQSQLVCQLTSRFLVHTLAVLINHCSWKSHHFIPVVLHIGIKSYYVRVLQKNVQHSSRACDLPRDVFLVVFAVQNCESSTAHMVWQSRCILSAHDAIT